MCSNLLWRDAAFVPPAPLRGWVIVVPRPERRRRALVAVEIHVIGIVHPDQSIRVSAGPAGRGCRLQVFIPACLFGVGPVLVSFGGYVSQSRHLTIAWGRGAACPRWRPEAAL
jgi:hypothetical protein